MVHRIACDHMSGLLSRPHMTAAKMGSATRGPNITAACFADGSHGFPRVLGSIDHTHLLEQASASSMRRRPHAELGHLVVWLQIMFGTICMGEDDSFAYADGGALRAPGASAVKADRRSPPQAAWP